MFNVATIAALILSTIFIIFFIKKWKKSKKSSIRFPPGPKTLPIIGNLHQLSSLPFRSFRDLSKIHGPIFHLKLGSTAAVVVSSPEIAKLMLKDLDPIFTGRPRSVAFEIMWYNYADIAFSPYGGYSRQMRKICINELLSPKMVRSFHSIRSDEASRLINSLIEASGNPINLTEKIFSFSNSVTCRAAIGGAYKDNQAVMELVIEAVEFAGGFEIADFFPNSRIVAALSWTRLRLKMMRREVDSILDEIINSHRRNLGRNGEFGGEDLVDALLRVDAGEDLQFPIGNDGVRAVLLDVFAGGIETSAVTVDWAMVELLRNPNVMAKAQAELRRQDQRGCGSTNLGKNDIVHDLKYLKLVIRETLRLHAPIPILPRACREDCEINGYLIPAATNVFVNIWGMQRDGRFWKDPERFEPERFEKEFGGGGEFQYFPFGSGSRNCPGMMFAVAMAELALAQLLYNFDWKLPEGVRAEDLDMIEKSGLAASRKQNLFVVATPYRMLN